MHHKPPRLEVWDPVMRLGPPLPPGSYRDAMWRRIKATLAEATAKIIFRHELTGLKLFPPIPQYDGSVMVRVVKNKPVEKVKLTISLLKNRGEDDEHEE